MPLFHFQRMDVSPRGSVVLDVLLKIKLIASKRPLCGSPPGKEGGMDFELLATGPRGGALERIAYAAHVLHIATWPCKRGTDGRPRSASKRQIALDPAKTDPTLALRPGHAPTPRTAGPDFTHPMVTERTGPTRPAGQTRRTPESQPQPPASQ